MIAQKPTPKKLLTGRRAAGHDTPTETVHVDNLDQNLLLELEVGTLARRDGLYALSNDNPAASELFEQLEQSLRDKFSNISSQARSFAGRTQHKVIQIKASDPFHDLADAIAHMQDVQLPDIIADGQKELADADNVAKRSKMEFEQFRLEHDISRAPLPRRKIWVVVTIFAAAVGSEAMLNGQFLADAVEGGARGGTLIAAGFAAFNVTCATALGYSLGRHAFFSPSKFRRCLAQPVLALGILALTGSHMFFATFREQVIKLLDLQDAADAAWTILRETPLHWIQDASSVILVGIGLLVTGFGLLKGMLAFSDPIPGYSDLQDRFLQARMAHQATRAAIRMRIDAVEAQMIRHTARSEAMAEVQIRDLRDAQTALVELRQKLLDLPARARGFGRRILADYAAQLHRFDLDQKAVKALTAGRLAVPRPDVSALEDTMVTVQSALKTLERKQARLPHLAAQTRIAQITRAAHLHLTPSQEAPLVRPVLMMPKPGT